MRINPITPVTYKGKINTGLALITALSIGSVVGAYFINKKTNKEVKK